MKILELFLNFSCLLSVVFFVFMVYVSFNIDVSVDEQRECAVWSLIQVILFGSMLTFSLLKLKHQHYLYTIIILLFFLQTLAIFINHNYIFLPEEFLSLDFIFVLLAYFLLPVGYMLLSRHRRNGEFKREGN